jgi:hypothetical protein
MVLPIRSPTGVRSIDVIGGENLFYIAARYLGSADQWWRIANLNAFPGVQPDFIVAGPGKLLIPQTNLNATEP